MRCLAHSQRLHPAENRCNSHLSGTMPGMLQVLPSTVVGLLCPTTGPPAPSRNDKRANHSEQYKAGLMPEKATLTSRDAASSHDARQPERGWGGIRTHGSLATTPVFKTGAFNHSATHPIREITGFRRFLVHRVCPLTTDSDNHVRRWLSKTDTRRLLGVRVPAAPEPVKAGCDNRPFYTRY
jgi:hypothetical protein